LSFCLNLMKIFGEFHKNITSLLSIFQL